MVVDQRPWKKYLISACYAYLLIKAKKLAESTDNASIINFTIGIILIGIAGTAVSLSVDHNVIVAIIIYHRSNRETAMLKIK